jgi:hypothetical protein
MLKRLGIALFAVLLVSFLVAPCGAQLVTNGGFEDGNFSGWTQTGNTGFTSVSNAAAYVHSGSYGAQLGPVGSDGFLSQSLVTVPGVTYNVTFWLKNVSGTPNDFSAMWGSDILLSLTDIAASASFTEYSFNPVATASTTILEFGFRNDPGYLALDDVSVTGPVPTVPEPMSLFLFGAGLVGMTVIGRKNRKEEV